MKSDTTPEFKALRRRWDIITLENVVTTLPNRIEELQIQLFAAKKKLKKLKANPK